MKSAKLAGAVCLAALITATTIAQDKSEEKEACNQGACEISWKGMSHERMREIDAFADGYKDFLAKARTELSTVSATLEMVQAAGFTELKDGEKIRPGRKYYSVNRDRAMTLIVGGNKPVREGVRIVASHIDSPRLELKGRPVYGKSGFALFQTKRHGGIKTYQWSNIPLALTGRVDKRDGTVVNIEIGLAEDDPILMIHDLSPHTASAQMKRNARDTLSVEELDPIIAHGPHGIDGKFSAEQWVMRFLKANYDIDPADLVSAELALVPAMKPRDVGFDRRLMAAYGQDDRLSAYGSIKAAMEMGTPDQTVLIFLADNEESGNVNNTGASSSYLTDLIGELIYAQEGDSYREPLKSAAYRKSKALSIDVNPGVNPMNPGVWESGNAPKLGYGVNIKLYGRGFNANSEFIAWVRDSLDSAGVPWQTATYKAPSGGGTLGGELSRMNIETIDFGVPLHSIHTPYAVSDKSDVLALKNGIKAFMLHDR